MSLAKGERREKQKGGGGKEGDKKREKEGKEKIEKQW